MKLYSTIFIAITFFSISIASSKRTLRVLYKNPIEQSCHKFFTDQSIIFRTINNDGSKLEACIGEAKKVKPQYKEILQHIHNENSRPIILASSGFGNMSPLGCFNLFKANNPNHFCLIVAQKDNIVGYADGTIDKEKKLAHLANLAIEKQFHRKGYGSFAFYSYLHYLQLVNVLYTESVVKKNNTKMWKLLEQAEDAQLIKKKWLPVECGIINILTSMLGEYTTHEIKTLPKIHTIN